MHLSCLTKLDLRCSLSAGAAYTAVFMVNISKTYEDTLMWVWKVSRSNISTLPCSRDFKWCDDLSTRFRLSSETPSSMCTFVEWPWCQMDFLCMIKCSLHQDSSIFQKFWSKFINTVQIMILITFLTIQKKLRKIFLQQFMIIFHLKRKQKFKIKITFLEDLELVQLSWTQDPWSILSSIAISWPAMFPGQMLILELSATSNAFWIPEQQD